MARPTNETDPTNLSSKAGQGRAPAASDAAPAPAGGRPAQPALGVRGWARWMWRQLTSMRVALMLLLLLAVAALPGSFFPQQPQNPDRVSQYHLDHPQLAPWLDRFGFFDVYGSPWFAAIYLLLFTSLIGCILPRIAVHWRALRSQPPRVPRNLERFPAHEERTVAAGPDDVRTRVLAALKGRYRTAVTPEGITAERGYLRETGNIVFHLSLVGLLVSLAAGQLFSYRGQAVVIEGQSFANSVLSYDSFDPGTFFEPDQLEPFTFTLTKFESTFNEVAQARNFKGELDVVEPDGSKRSETIRVNHPVTAGGANVYLSGNGFAPVITVRDGVGKVAFSGAVPFLPQDGTYTSKGVVKVPDVSTGDQLGLTGMFLPTALVAPDGTAQSIYPQPDNPMLALTLYAGDLGLDDGVPQNVYVLDTERMRQVYEPAPGGKPGSAEGGQKPVSLMIRPGETVQLPEGLGSVTFESLPRFAALDLRYDPSLPYLLTFAVTAMVGLFGSLFVPRRRMWVRVRPGEDGGSVVEGAALARGDDPGLDKDLERVMSAAGAARQNEDAQASAGPPAAATGEAVATSAGAGPAQEGH
ncbi:cytochrome c biogenesis protein ResB [Georgenia thermotolerans]|uniref:Cytochrome c biogenesis protein ResB n=1 Tax=Georgenia thermotolerans TaxID=527326 RepID=A0A7J5UPN0_9MICO|nr:cytochrome c biogenesis protein ResB [Georgenia thermotolerans]KAE8764366.1 cytochrome c biogenesis protein ResB [Georgenia thermotolerans]